RFSGESPDIARVDGARFATRGPPEAPPQWHQTQINGKPCRSQRVISRFRGRHSHGPKAGTQPRGRAGWGLNPVNLLSRRLHSEADFLWLELGRQEEPQATGVEGHPWIDD